MNANADRANPQDAAACVTSCKDSTGYVHLRGIKINGENKFYAPDAFFVGFRGKAIFTANKAFIVSPSAKTSASKSE